MKMVLQGLMMSIASTALITSLSLGISKIYAEVPEGSPAIFTAQDKMSESEQELIELFFAAAKTGNHEVVQEFLNHGFPVDVRNSAGYTALMMATYYGHQDIVTSLIEHGANRCERDLKGNTALMGAIVKAEWSIAKQLRKVDCDVDAKKTGQKTAAEFAKMFGQEQKLMQLGD